MLHRSASNKSGVRLTRSTHFGFSYFSLISFEIAPFSENSLCFAEQFRIADKPSVVQYTDEQAVEALRIDMFDASIYKANRQV